MRLEGIHHITAITADAPRNVDFYARVLGLRLVKKTVNFDAPSVYHLYFGDEQGAAGSILTFFEFPGARRGRPGAGQIHTLRWRVGSPAAIGFWEERLAAEDVATRRDGARLAFADPEGLRHELEVVATPDAPLVAAAPDVPAEHAIQGFEGARAYARDPDASRALLEEHLGFEPRGEAGWTVRGEGRSASWSYDAPPAEPGIEGAGSVHHIAWAAADDDELQAWRMRAAQGGARVTPPIDRQYFHSIYFREPSGVLFEVATLQPGFAIDEPAESLGESLRLPPQHEHLRAELERTLTPLRNPRVAGVA